MSVLNRPTWKQKFQDFINRVAPFLAPLIPKTEHQELVGDDLSDSIIFNTSVSDSIVSPLAAFSVDFNTTDLYTIDTTGSVDTAFTITLLNLKPNSTGLIEITKKLGDTFTFGNGIIVPVNDTTHQVGITTLPYIVKFVDGNYQVFTGVESLEVLPVQFKVLEIGAWDMVNTASVVIPHGILNAIDRIIGVNVVIRSDTTAPNVFANNFETGGPYYLTDPNISGKVTWDGTNITLVRRDLGAFAGFTATFPGTYYGNGVINRGRIFIEFKT